MTTANLLDCLLALSLADLGLHISLGNDVSHGGTNDSSGVFHCTASSLLGDFILNTLLVLATVQDGPLNFTWITLHQERAFALLVDESEGLQRQKEALGQ